MLLCIHWSFAQGKITSITTDVGVHILAVPAQFRGQRKRKFLYLPTPPKQGNEKTGEKSVAWSGAVFMKCALPAMCIVPASRDDVVQWAVQNGAPDATVQQAMQEAGC